MSRNDIVSQFHCAIFKQKNDKQLHFGAQNLRMTPFLPTFLREFSDVDLEKNPRAAWDMSDMRWMAAREWSC